jgi:hypothetical protein
LEYPVEILSSYEGAKTLSFLSDENSLLFSLHIETDDFDDFDIESTFERIAKFALIKAILPKPVFFPSERQGVSLFGKELLENRLKKYEELNNIDDLESYIANKRSKPINYVEPVSQYLSLFREVILGSPRLTKFSKVADYISSDIMNGSVKPSDSGDLIFFSKSDVKPIDMSLVSSTVKSLSFLSYFLQTKAVPGQILFIDEPEINLHPRNQIKIARALVSLSNAGVNLIISTHSEYVIREINSLITLGSKLKTKPIDVMKLLDTYGITEESIIDYRKAKVYSFNGGKVRNNPISDTGFDIDEIDNDTTEMNDRTMDIFMALNEEE